MVENLAVEFHDSVLEGATITADGASVLLLDAYVHRSNGRPGFDAGTGWTQAATIVLQGFSGEAPQFMTISVGRLIAGGRAYENVVPVPLEAHCATRIELQGTRGELATLTGESIAMMVTAAAKYVEEFEGAARQ
jgi:hypothetical protein